MNNVSRYFFVVIAACVVLVSNSAGEVIHNIHFSPASPASLPLNQNLSITFNYTCNQSGGIRIFARPFTNGALTPNYTASGSPLYPVGSGTGNGTFMITTGNVVVDHIRFQVLNADQSTLLLEFFIPVNYHFSTNAITNIVMTPVTPAPRQLGENLNLTFDYSTNEAGGVRIFARPFTHGTLSPGYSASASPLYSSGSSSGTGFFTILSGDVLVDSVRFQMLNSDQSQLLLEFFIPVQYHFAAHAISNIQLTPSSPGTLPFNSHLDITFDYTTNQAGGVRIFPRPYTQGALSPNYAASPSPLYATGDGSATGYFTITSSDVTVDSIRFQMYNSDQSVLLLEYFVPINFHFGKHAITNIQFSPTSPAYFTNMQADSSSFNYTTDNSGGVLIFPRPFSGDVLAPNYAASGSSLYPTGTGSAAGYFYISSGNGLIDQMRFQMMNSDQSQTLLEFFVPVQFYYGNVASVSVENANSSIPASYSLSQNYPNPFNPSTSISFRLPSKSFVSLKVFDLIGREAATLVSEELSAGNHTKQWNANRMPSGVYFYRLQAGSFTETKKLVLLK
jgi:hypothetical protein